MAKKDKNKNNEPTAEAKAAAEPEVEVTDVVATPAPEADAAATEPEVATGGSEKKTLPNMGDKVHVRPTKGTMHEPFQNLRLPSGSLTPVVYTSWIESQVQAGKLEVC